MRVSRYFKLGKAQHQLDFVNVDLGKDLPIFVDPYALSIPEDEWFIEANNLVFSFFSLLVELIHKGELERARGLLSNLGEPEGTYIGLSKKNPKGTSGRGVGNDQSDDLFNKLKDSEAAKTGNLTDLSDCELLIPGIGADKISDITINIIRGKLAEYTTQQCELHNIPTQSIACPPYWDAETQRWTSKYHKLPIYNGRPLLLIPKSIARIRMMIDAKSFYRHGVLEFLQQEHLSANTGLVHLLKNGKKVVYKKDLEEEHPFSKEFLYQFTQDHPDILENYKNSLDKSLEYMTDAKLEDKQSKPESANYDSIVNDLIKIPKGRKHAGDYHSHVIGILELVLYPMLRTPRKEADILDGRKRVDIRFNNGFAQGFFGSLYKNYQIKAPFIFFECKNYSSELANPEFDQLTGRFSGRRGNLGFIVCRVIEDREFILAQCRDVVADGRGYIMVLEDKDLIHLIERRKEGDYEGISDFFDNRFREIII